MQLLFSRIAFAVNRIAVRSGSLFRDRHHRHELTTPTEVRRALVYVLFNSQKHESGAAVRVTYSALPHLDPCSSVAWFTDWDPRARPPPQLVARDKARIGASPLCEAQT